MNKRIKYLDGLKGVIALIIVLTHYMLALWPQGYVGFGSEVEENTMREHISLTLPWSLFSNTSISLYLLFGMISLFIVVSFRSAGNSQKLLEKKALGRYFQFLIPVFTVTLAAYILYETGALSYEGLADQTGSSWNRAVIPTTDSVWLMLFYGLIGIYFNNRVEFLTVLWCMHLIFIGSYLTYGVLALFGNCGKRWICYLAFFVIAFFYPSYLIFAAGAVNGELFYRWRQREGQKEEGTTSFTTWRSTFCGGVLIFAGLMLGMVPSPFLPSGISLEMTYAVSSFLILCGLMLCRKLQCILSQKVFTWLGKYMFSMILTHIFVLYTFSAWLYRLLSVHTAMGSGALFLITALVSLPPVLLCAVGFYRLCEEPSRKLAKYISKFVMEKGKEREK